jgi:hypothetical protein
MGRLGPATTENDLAACVAMARPRHGHYGRSWRSGTGGAGSPLGKVQLGVWDEHHRGGGHSPGNVRERAAHRDDGTA